MGLKELKELRELKELKELKKLKEDQEDQQIPATKTRLDQHVETRDQDPVYQPFFLAKQLAPRKVHVPRRKTPKYQKQIAVLRPLISAPFFSKIRPAILGCKPIQNIRKLYTKNHNHSITQYWSNYIANQCLLNLSKHPKE